MGTNRDNLYLISVIIVKLSRFMTRLLIWECDKITITLHSPVQVNPDKNYDKKQQKILVKRDFTLTVFKLRKTLQLLMSRWLVAQ